MSFMLASAGPLGGRPAYLCRTPASPQGSEAWPCAQPVARRVVSQGELENSPAHSSQISVSESCTMFVVRGASSAKKITAVVVQLGLIVPTAPFLALFSARRAFALARIGTINGMVLDEHKRRHLNHPFAPCLVSLRRQLWPLVPSRPACVGATGVSGRSKLRLVG